MQVFKLCLKILKKNLPLMLMYIGIFLTISLLMSSATESDQSKNDLFIQAKADAAFISEEQSVLIDGFKEELEKTVNFIELSDETEALQDALYFREVSYILRIPKGFTESLMTGGDVQIEKTVVPDSYSDRYIDIAVNKYFNAAKLYIAQVKGITQEQLAKNLKSDLSEETKVELKAISVETSKSSGSNYFFNYLAYTLLAVIILGMSSLMVVYNNHDLKRRNACSPISANRSNIQFVLAVLLFTVLSWLVMVLIYFVFHFKDSLNINTLYFLLNSIIFAICAASISYLIGNLIRSREAISAVNNVVTLGLSFISGVFVPQMLLGSSVLKVARFTPTFWYVRANNIIDELVRFDYAQVKPVLSCMLIELGFALAFFAVALVIAKKKRFE